MKDKVSSAITINFALINNANLKLIAYNKLFKHAIKYQIMSFFVIAQQSIYNYLISNITMATDKHRDAASFWYIQKMNPLEFDSTFSDQGHSVVYIDEIFRKLKTIRDKIHFHTDISSLADARFSWQCALLNGKEVKDLISILADVLMLLEQNICNKSTLTLTKYEGSDIDKIICAYEKVYSSVHGENEW
jgi:hypothetical protein